MRWASSRKALPSEVRDMLRVERTSSLMPKRASRALMRRPIMAGATPSWRAAAERLPSVATATKLSSCLKRLIPRARPEMADSTRQQQGGQFGPNGRQLFRVGPALVADLDARPPEAFDLVGQCAVTGNAGQFDLEGVALGRFGDGTADHEPGFPVVQRRADDQCRLVVGAGVPVRHGKVDVNDVAGLGRIAFAHGA